MTRLALVLGGGASLGSYGAGAATEILLALLGNRASGRVTVDVVTGASSGALTAGLVARTLAVNVHLLPWIERAWVDGVDASALLDRDRPPGPAWLDVTALEQLATALIDADPASDDEPAAMLGEPLRVGLALSNLGGIRYDFRYGFLNAPDRFYGTRVHADRIEFEIGRGRGAGDPVWSRLRDAALASAAFPFAFPPRALGRRPAEYPGARLPRPGPEGTIPMWYVDGGLFDNAPLGLAKRLVERDPGHREADWRYVLVEPSLRSSRAGEERALEPGDGILRLAGLLAGAVLGQGAARDWVRANKVNARLEILHAIVARLPELGSRLADPDAVALGREIGALAERVAEREVAVRATPGEDGGPDPVLDCLDENARRIEADPRYGPALAAIPSRAGRARLAKFILILEAASGLRDKDRMPLYLVAPRTAGELCGDFLGNFGGLFCREWRANDFRAGRRDARRLLEEHLADVVVYEPAGESAYAVDDLEPSFDALPAESRRSLERVVGREVDRWLDGVRPGGAARLLRWAWAPALRAWARGRAMEALRQLG